MGVKERLKPLIPWPAKMTAKLVLARLPLSHTWFNRLGFFEHGAMRDLGYARGVFSGHLAHLPGTPSRRPSVCLELGPGDSLLSALVGRACGVERMYLVDVGRFASEDVGLYRDAALELGPTHFLSDPRSWESVDDVLRACNASYDVDGVAALARIPDASVDLLWSHAVLEHVLRSDFEPIMRETARILKEDGVASHLIDLRDHLASSLNSLRFSPRVWESGLFRSSGFYTNRLRASQIRSICESVGLATELTSSQTWPELPMARDRMDPTFRDLPEDDLRIQTCNLVLRRR